MTPRELRERLEKNPVDLEKLRHAHECAWNVDGFVDAVHDPAVESTICQVLGVPTEVEKSGQSAQTQFFLSLALGLITMLIITVAASAALFKW